MRRRRPLLVAALVALILAPLPASEAATPSLCGRFDLPETGLQGTVPRADQISGRAFEGYNCGVSVVGHSSLGGKAGNANMAWAGDCAYVSSLTGVAVVDVSDPRAPKHVSTLTGEGSSFTVETIAAIKVGDRAVLAAGRYGPAPFPVPAPVDLYDISDCAHPKLVTTFLFEKNVHNLTFSPDGTRLYATQPIQVLDITNLAHPVFLGHLEDQIRGTLLDYDLAHEVELSADGNTMYIGGQTVGFQTFKVVDITGWPQRAPRVLFQRLDRGHGVSLATVNGRRYLMHSEESIVPPLALGCAPSALNPFSGAAQPFISDINDTNDPHMRISQFRLEINERENCATQLIDGVNASTHYHDVDDPEDTTFGMVSMWNAGLRIVDLRDPYRPREVGYFNPGASPQVGGLPLLLDFAWSHIRYVPSTGHIWFATALGGFWVVELEPQVRAALGLPALPSDNPDGAPPRPLATRSTLMPTRLVDLTAAYCTLAPLVGLR